MIKTFAFILVLLTGLQCSAQTATDLPEVVIGPYKWATAVLINEVTGGDKVAKSDVLTSIKGQLFDIVEIDGDDVTFMVRIYTSDPDGPDAKAFNFAVDAGGSFIYDAANRRQRRYFRVDKETIQKYALHNSVVRQSLNFGLVNFPFKFRLLNRNGNFSGAFNFGAAVGWTAPKRAFRDGAFSILTGYSISNVVLERSDVRRNAGDLEKANNYTAFSFSVGPMFELSTVQVITSVGFDFLNRNNQKTFGWIDQGKPWISVGIGYAIFTKQGKEKITGKGN